MASTVSKGLGSVGMSAIISSVPGETLVSKGRREHSPLSNLHEQKTSAKSVKGDERASIVAESQPVASNGKSMRRMGTNVSQAQEQLRAGDH